MSHFAALLEQFVDLYESDPEALEIGLIQADEGIRATHEEPRYKDESKAKRLSQKRTRQEIQKRLLAVLGELKKPIRNGEGQSSEQPRNLPAITWKGFKRQRIGEIKHILADELEITIEEVDRLLAERGMSAGALLHLERDPEFQEVEAKRKFAELARPDFHIFFAREFLSWLDLAVAQVENLEEIRYRKSIPSHLKRFLGEAYRCYLFGLDAACAALCGAILQEAIRVKMNAVGFTGLDEAIREASSGDVPLLTEEAENAAREVKHLRDMASHGNQEFVNSQEYQRKYVLSATREILDTLFEDEN